MRGLLQSVLAFFTVGLFGCGKQAESPPPAAAKIDVVLNVPGMY